MGPSRAFEPGRSGECPIPPEIAAGPRPDDVSMMEATAGARQPAWFNWLNPLIGAVGVWFGSRKLCAERVRRTAGSP